MSEKFTFRVKPKRSFYQQYKASRQAVENMGDKVVRRLEESEQLRHAVRAGDWIARDQILIERSGRSMERWFKWTIIPILATLFFGFPVFLAALGNLVWRIYCLRRNVGEIMGDWPDEERNCAKTVRRTVTCALATVLGMFLFRGYSEFWIIMIGGWLGTLGLGATAWSAFYRYGNSLASPQQAPIEADEIGMLDEEENRERTPEEQLAFFKEFLQGSVIYGFAKELLPVFPIVPNTPLAIEWNDRHRFNHSYFIGKTGMGMSQFLRNIICQDIHFGAGVVVMGHERDLFERIMDYYPSHRVDDLIYYNPGDRNNKIIGFNLFEHLPHEDPTFKAGEIYTVLERTLDDLGQTMKPILQSAIDALVSIQQGKTLRDLESLIDPEGAHMRQQVLASPDVPERTKRFWAQYADSSVARTGSEPLLRRLLPLFQEPLLTTLSMASFNFSEQINLYSRVLMLDLSALRGRQQQMVGQFLIALIRETFYARDVLVPDQHYLPYFFYIDEFQEYAGHSEEALRQIFRGLRKYGIGITIANQRKSDISERMMGTIVGNVGTLGCFQLAHDEANYFAGELGVREKVERSKPSDTEESLREQYERVYHEYRGPNKEGVLKNLQARMQRLEAEGFLGTDEEEPQEALGRLRPDLLQDPKLQPYHIVMRGAKKTIVGSMHASVPEYPPGIAKQETFTYDDLVRHSQQQYGKEVATTPSKPSPGAAEDDYLIPRQS